VVTARQRYTIRRLGRVYGIVGKVAGRYVAAGYSVELNHPTRYGPIHIVARGNGQVLAVDVVYERGRLTVDAARAILEKAKLIRARPILAAYGFRWSDIPEDVRRFCEENGVKLRTVGELEID
jgi:predicted RecB family endonuclease